VELETPPKPWETPPTGSRCATHPDRDAMAVCQRCGDFACLNCLIWRGVPGNHCAGCRPHHLREIRTRMIGHETRIRGIGSLYFLMSTAFLLPLIVMIGVGLSEGLGTVSGELGVVLIMGVISGGLIYLGHGVRKLRTWSRPVAIAMSSLGLLAIPFGTIINGYFMWLLLSQRGRQVFSDEYRAVIEATPEIRYRSSPVVLVAFVLLLLLIAAAIAIPLYTAGHLD
jgi:hypothetical protein